MNERYIRNILLNTNLCDFVKSLAVMRYLIFLSLLLVFSCQAPGPSKEDELIAAKVIDRVDEKVLQTFREWNYFSRGGDNWERRVADTVQYTVNYQEGIDTTQLYVYKAEWFAIEFECNYLLNHQQYYIFDFVKYQDSLLLIVGAGNDGRDTLIEKDLKVKTIFKTKDPFRKLKELNDLRKSLGVLGIAYMKKEGGFYQFFLSDKVVLSYLPDYININEEWVAELAKGKLIKPKWNLRKMDR
jgi:hypothetical protein